MESTSGTEREFAEFCGRMFGPISVKDMKLETVR